MLKGPSGSGKSRYVWEQHPDLYTLDPPQCSNQSVWFDGYDGQDVLLIDDFDGWLSYKFLLRLLDRYPLRVQYKGGSIPLLATKIYITSTESPSDWYPHREEVVELERRIHMTYRPADYEHRDDV